ncbi:MAG: two-component sensor histidine kinase [Melioribacteraceae bacterium]|nr:two-component sensor histidine kinase [Melioribacteraceae bacterium]
MSRLKENFFYSRVFLSEFIILGLILFLFAILLSDSLLENLLLLSLIIIGLIYFVDSVGAKRKEQIRIIQKAFDDIKNNVLASPDEISLGKQLFELEADIKSMFLKTQTDIANLKKLEQVRTEFLGNVSHELRTPIFAIQGFLETLLGGAVDDPKVNRNFVAKAYSHTNNLNNLLHDLIDISMIESGQMRMSFRYFNVQEFLIPIVNDFKPAAAEKNIELILYNIKSKLELFGDKTRIKQVVTNLISNAIKYTERGKVEILVLEEGKFGRILVRDTGLGIADKDISRIFERFYRVDKDRSRAVGGTGLGLAIVKHILEAHNTKMEVKSEPGKGSEFSFLLKK